MYMSKSLKKLAEVEGGRWKGKRKGGVEVGGREGKCRPSGGG